MIYGDATRSVLLQRVGIARAKLIAVAITDPTATRQIVQLARSLNPEAAILARTRYVLDVDRLQVAGANVVVAEELEGTIDLVSETLRIFGITEGAIERFTAELRDEGYEMLRMPSALALDPWLTELLERVSTEWIEVPVSFEGEASLADLEFRARTGASVLAVDRGGTTSANPPPSFAIRAGDRLLVFGGSEAVARIPRPAGNRREPMKVPPGSRSPQCDSSEPVTVSGRPADCRCVSARGEERWDF